MNKECNAVMGEQDKSYPLRLEPELKEWVKQKAKENDRSVNAEINRTVRKAKEAEDQKKSD